ncbi:MAG: DUF3786 domain-containing protein [Candidatus Brocadiaceae bacterium]|jgi:hypothetical protein
MQAPEQDHYSIARQKALERVKERWDPGRLRKLGAKPSDDALSAELPLLNWRVDVRPEPYRISVLPEGDEPGIVWQILTLDYLGAEEVLAPSGFVSFADFVEGRGYQRAFEGRVNRRLTSTAGRDRDAFVEAVERLGGAVVEGDPVRCILRFFPLLEFQVTRHDADEDFPASCTVLLPDNALRLFSLEDTIVAAEKLVSALEGKTPVVSTA